MTETQWLITGVFVLWQLFLFAKAGPKVGTTKAEDLGNMGVMMALSVIGLVAWGYAMVLTGL